MEDTIVHVRISRNDPTTLTKVRQFYFQFIRQLNPEDVDSIFRCRMSENSLPVEASYVEYLDLKKDSVIDSDAPKGSLSGYLASDIDTLDILKSIGVRAYAKPPLQVLLRPVKVELIIAMALMFLVMACIIKLISDISRLHKAGFRLIRMVSQKAEESLNEAAGQISETSGKLQEKGLEEESVELEKVKEGILVNTGYFERLRSILDNEERKIVFDKTPLRIRYLLESLREQYEKTNYKNVVIDIQADDDLYIYTDECYLRRVFEELLNNSVKYSNDPVRILIMATQNKQEITIVVCDSGWGITSDDLKNIFIINHDVAKLFKEGISKETKAGLGLSFAMSFTRTLGGVMQVTCKDGITGIKLIFSKKKADMEKIAQARIQERKNLSDFSQK